MASARPGLALALVAASASLLIRSRRMPTAAATVGGKAILPPVTTAGQDQRFALAARDFRAGRHAVAFTQFSRLADEGHTRAARVVLRVLSDGPAVYDIGVSVGSAQLARWRSAARAGDTRAAPGEAFDGIAGSRH